MQFNFNTTRQSNKDIRNTDYSTKIHIAEVKVSARGEYVKP